MPGMLPVCWPSGRSARRPASIRDVFALGMMSSPPILRLPESPSRDHERQVGLDPASKDDHGAVGAAHDRTVVGRRQRLGGAAEGAAASITLGCSADAVDTMAPPHGCFRSCRIRARVVEATHEHHCPDKQRECRVGRARSQNRQDDDQLILCGTATRDAAAPQAEDGARLGMRAWYEHAPAGRDASVDSVYGRRADGHGPRACEGRPARIVAARVQ